MPYPHVSEQDLQEARDEAQGLAGRSLLQAVDSGGYRMHDLLLDFARDRIKPGPLESAVSRQVQYLSMLNVLWRYVIGGHNTEGLYSLMALWRSVQELCDNPRVQVEAYREKMQVWADDETTNAALLHGALGELFSSQVGVGRPPTRQSTSNRPFIVKTFAIRAAIPSTVRSIVTT